MMNGTASKNTHTIEESYALGVRAFRNVRKEEDMTPRGEIVVCGCYTQRDLEFVTAKGEGIAIFRRVKDKTDAVSMVHMSTLSYSGDNPSYIISDESGETIYVADENYKEGCGTITAYAVNRERGELERLNAVSSHGKATCHMDIVTIPGTNESFLAAASYFGPGFSLHRIVKENGRTKEIAEAHYVGDHRVVKRVGTRSVVFPGTNKARQESAHPHMCVFDVHDGVLETSRDEKRRSQRVFLHVVDLGIDAVLRYRLDVSTGRCEYVDALMLPEGAGPRHMCFHPNIPVAYIINELNSTISTCAVNEKDGSLRIVDTMSALPSGFCGAGDDSVSTCAAIRIHPTGRWVYASNRVVDGSGILSHFEIHPKRGTLCYKSATLTGGSTPRDFNFASNGKELLVANQESGSVLSFRVEGSTGVLSFTGAKAKTPTPVCLCVL